MTKKQFCDELRRALRGLSDEEIQSSLDYYEEIIDDRIESGMSEEEAVAALGAPEDIAREIMLDMPLPKIIKTKYRQKSTWRTWEIILLILGSPVWLPLLLTAAILVITVYIVIWSVAISLWAIDASLAACSVTGLFLFCVLLGSGNFLSAFLYLGAGLTLAGLSIFMFLGCNAFTALTVKLGSLIWRALKSIFIRKGDKQ